MDRKWTVDGHCACNQWNVIGSSFDVAKNINPSTSLVPWPNIKKYGYWPGTSYPGSYLRSPPAATHGRGSALGTRLPRTGRRLWERDWVPSESMVRAQVIPNHRIITRAAVVSVRFCIVFYFSMSSHVIEILQLHHRDRLCESESC